MKKLWVLSIIGLISFQFSSSAAHGIPKQRYQIVFGRYLRADTFLLDTYTGRIWVPTEITSLKGEPTIWVEQKIADEKREIGLPMSAWREIYGRKNEPPASKLGEEKSASKTR